MNDTRYLMNPHACEYDRSSQRERDRNEFLRQRQRAIDDARPKYEPFVAVFNCHRNDAKRKANKAVPECRTF